MPPPSNPPAKRGRPAFKPPRPTTKPTKTKTKTTKHPRRKSAPAKHSFLDTAAEASEDSEEDDDDDAELLSSSSPSHIPSPSPSSPSSTSTPHPTTTPSTPQDAPPTIPPALLTRLLYHHFHNDTVRIGKDANGVVGKYIDTFVREAIARAAFERRESGGEGIGGDFLEVEDLEKLAPQLLLDF